LTNFIATLRSRIRSTHSQIFLLDVEVAIAREANDEAQRGQIDRLRRFMRIDLDRSDSRSGFGVDQHPVAALQRFVACQEIVQMPGLLQAHRHDFWQ
jgi:hypothetical protein